MIDVNYCVDIDTLVDFDLAERAIEQKQLDIDVPRPTSERALRGWPSPIELLVFDFDGVFTDNRVLVLQDGREAVVCNRGDGMGLSMLRDKGLPMAVLSTEVNPVVDARCKKLRLECRHGLADKRCGARAIGPGEERRLEAGRVRRQRRERPGLHGSGRICDCRGRRPSAGACEGRLCALALGRGRSRAGIV